MLNAKIARELSEISGKFNGKNELEKAIESIVLTTRVGKYRTSMLHPLSTGTRKQLEALGYTCGDDGQISW